MLLFSYAKDELNEDEDESDRQVSEHFDFGYLVVLAIVSMATKQENNLLMLIREKN